MGLKSFYVQLDECTSLSGSRVIDDEHFNYPGTLDLEYNNDTHAQIDLVTIKVTKKINDVDYHFYSPPYSNSMDDLRIRIEFLKSFVIHYNEQDPNEYSFEFVAS
jgi:hypothetical protein